MGRSIRARLLPEPRPESRTSLRLRTSTSPSTEFPPVVNTPPRRAGPLAAVLLGLPGLLGLLATLACCGPAAPSSAAPSASQSDAAQSDAAPSSTAPSTAGPPTNQPGHTANTTGMTRTPDPGPVTAAEEERDAALWTPLPADDPLVTDAGGQPTLEVEGLLNGGFELIADDSTSPPKYGAYWVGAFARVEGDATDLIAEQGAHGGARCLRLPAGASVHQKLIADPRWSERVQVELWVRPEGAGARLDVALIDGPGQRAVAQVDAEFAHPAIVSHEPGPDGWHHVQLALGARFLALHERKPLPRLQLQLTARGDAGSAVQVDDASARLHWPAVTAGELRGEITRLVRWQLALWFEPAEAGGLELVDPDTGYVRASGYDVESGERGTAARWVFFHTIHNLLIEWLRHAHDQGLQTEVERWTPHLQRITRTLLERNFHPESQLPHTFNLKTGRAHLSPVTVASFVQFLLDAADLVGDDELAAAALAQARRTADALVVLQAEHDLPTDEVKNRWKLDGNKLVGEFPNWHGQIPNRLDHRGRLDPPKRFNTSWAIVTARKFWYHVFKSPAGIMAVHGRAPRPGDLDAVHRVVSLYDRPWDAARYDLENDTDDHYGYLCEDVLEILEYSDGRLPDALQLVQDATDHRLSRDTGRADDTIWIQGVRLGSACAGDSPRAFKGVLDLYSLPPDVNPVSSGLPLYRDAILELARNDLQGRQLTNSQFTESFFQDWEMVCICFHGTYQGDCRERPFAEWHGDVGDTFGGPPTSAIEAQGYAYQVAPGARERAEILAALGIIHHVTESSMRRRYGYLYGLDARVAQQYELPEKYTMGISTQSPASLGYVMAWSRLLPLLRDED